MKLLHTLIAAATLLAVAQMANATNIEVTKSVDVDASPATVWKLIGDFNHLDVWHPAVANSTVKGTDNKVGAVRTLTLAGGGGEIVEKLQGYDAKGMHYTYAILSGPLPVDHYTSTLTVSDAGNGKAKVTWKGNFDAKGAPDEKAKEVISGVYEGGLNRIASDFKK